MIEFHQATPAILTALNASSVIYVNEIYGAFAFLIPSTFIVLCSSLKTPPITPPPLQG